MPSLDLAALTAWITPAAVDSPDDLAGRLAEHAQVTRATASRQLQRLVDLHWLVRSGPHHRPIYRPGLFRQVVRRYALADVDEVGAWGRDIAPCFDLPPNIARMAQHGFGELLDNAVSHSGGTGVTVSVRQTPQQLQLLVSDNGCGLFAKLRTDFGLDDPTAAMLELSKGKLSSRPDAHGGRGLFFTSRMADVFDLHANDSAFQHRSWQPDAWHAGRPIRHGGTSVYAAFALDAPRSVDSVVMHYSLDGAGLAFERTVVPLKLLVTDRQGLETRAQARRVAARLDQFDRAEIDFSGIADVGHSFVDELFRVQAGRTARSTVAVNASRRVRAIVRGLTGTAAAPAVAASGAAMPACPAALSPCAPP